MEVCETIFWFESNASLIEIKGKYIECVFIMNNYKMHYPQLFIDFKYGVIANC